MREVTEVKNLSKITKLLRNTIRTGIQLPYFLWAFTFILSISSLVVCWTRTWEGDICPQRSLPSRDFGWCESLNSRLPRHATPTETCLIETCYLDLDLPGYIFYSSEELTAAFILIQMDAFCSDILDMVNSGCPWELLCVTHDNFDLSLDWSNALISVTLALNEE